MARPDREKLIRKLTSISGNEERVTANKCKIEDEGIIPRSMRYLWNQMSKRKDSFFVKASFVEIYNEQINDLLNKKATNLSIRWSQEHGFFIEDVLVVDCTSVDDLMIVFKEGCINRKTGSHDLNKDSSRSHSMLILYIVREFKDHTGKTIRGYGKMTFIDLAGSERLKESKTSGLMAKEAQQINKSLFTLGKIISILSKKQNTHLPFRDSKLTMLLMDSLG